MINKYPDLICLGAAEQYVEDIYEIINDINLFDNFDFDEVKSLCHFMQCYAAPRDYMLLKEGDVDDFVILILTGRVKVTRINQQKDFEFISKMGVGSTFGEISMIDSGPRLASCITTVPTDFAVLTRESFDDVLLQMPRLGNKILLKLVQNFTVRIREIFKNPQNEVVDGTYGASI